MPISYTLLACLAFSFFVISQTYALDTYSHWTRSAHRANKLLCPSHCDNDEQKDECCACNSKLCWELQNSNQSCNATINNLHVEYIDIHGTAIVLSRPGDRNASFWTLTYTDSHLTSLPVNVCHFPNLISVTLSYNNILTIGNISCLRNLDTLKLDHNKLTSVPNTTFQGLSGLRFVDLSSNSITKIEPNTISGTSFNIFRMDLSSNPVETFDITNVYIEHPFCEITMKNTELSKFSNELNFKVNTSRRYGPGYFDLKNCSILEFFNFTEFGVRDYADLVKSANVSFDLSGNNIACDCSVSYTLKHVPPTTLAQIYRDFENITCNAPAEIAGASIQMLHATKNYSAMTCGIDKDCPRLCSCFDQPSNDRIVVNCTGANLTEMPKYMPVGYWNNQNLHILLGGNQIRSIPPRSYINRIDNLELSGNPIQDISENAARDLKEGVILDLSSHLMKTFPRYFQNLDPNLITFGNTTVACDCSNTWIGDWLRNKKSSHFDTLLCNVDGDILFPEVVTLDFLSCSEDTFPFWVVGVGGGALTALLIILGLVYTCRVELRILARGLKNKYKETSTSSHCLFDILVSFCDEDGELRKWVNYSFSPYFTDLGYQLFIPYKHLPLGGSRNDDTSRVINKTIKFVIVLSEDYMNDEWTSHEFKSIWSHYLSDSMVKIIIVNFNNISRGEVKSNTLRSLMNVGNSLDFSFREEKLLKRLQRKLGPPCAGQNRHDELDFQSRTASPPPYTEKVGKTNTPVKDIFSYLKRIKMVDSSGENEVFGEDQPFPPQNTIHTQGSSVVYGRLNQPKFERMRYEFSSERLPYSDELFGEDFQCPPQKSSTSHPQGSSDVFDRLNQPRFERVCYKFNPENESYLCYKHKDKCSFGQLHRQELKYSQRFRENCFSAGSCQHKAQKGSTCSLQESIAEVEV